MRFVIAATLVASFAPSSPLAEACAPSAHVAVDGLGTPLADFPRIAELSGAVAPRPRLVERSGARSETSCENAALPWPSFAVGATTPAPAAGFSALPVPLVSTWNARYASGENDGLLWAGRGLSQEISAGLALRHGAVSAALAPAFTWPETARPSGSRGAARAPCGSAARTTPGRSTFRSSVPTSWGTTPT